MVRKIMETLKMEVSRINPAKHSQEFKKNEVLPEITDPTEPTAHEINNSSDLSKSNSVIINKQEEVGKLLKQFEVLCAMRKKNAKINHQRSN
jgi:hypothetical protein